MEETSYKFPSGNLLIEGNRISEVNQEDEKKKIERFFQNYKIDIDCKDMYISINSITYAVVTNKNK